LFTLGTAVFYVSDVLRNRTSGKLPDVPVETLALLGGSHAIYLGGKAYMMLFKQLTKENNNAHNNGDGIPDG
jgi:hypothetical protein